MYNGEVRKILAEKENEVKIKVKTKTKKMDKFQWNTENKIAEDKQKHHRKIIGSTHYDWLNRDDIWVVFRPTNIIIWLDHKKCG